MKTSRLLLAWLGAVPCALIAQQAPVTPLDLGSEMDAIIHTDQIKAASKRAQDVASAPADVVVLRGSDLRAQGYRTLGDALGGVLGFVTNQDHAYQGLGMAGNYVLGDQNSRVLVLLDGHALNSPAEVGSSKVGEDFGIPMELVDHVEIVRGPASSLYGNNAFQALVNVSTVFASGSVRSPYQAAATGGTGGLGELWAQGTWTLPGATASLMVSGFRRTGTALTFPQLGPEELPAGADEERRQSAYLYVKGGDWSFSGSMMNRRQGLASGPFDTEPGNLDTWYRNQRLAAELKWEPHTRDVAWMFRLFGDRNTFSDSFVQNLDGTIHPETDHDPDRSLGLEAQGRLPLGDRFSLTFGTEWQRHRFDGLYLDAATNDTVGTSADYLIGNTYLEGTWQPSDQWTAVAGLQRADWIPGTITNTLDGVGRRLEKDSISRITPRLTLIWKPVAGDVWKLVFGQGFRFPTIFERYYTDGTSQAANPGIQPEVLTSAQLSWSRKWGSSMTLHLAASSFTGRNIIVPGTTGQGGDAAQEQYQNAGDTQKGSAVETELAWRSGETEVSGGAGWYRWTYLGQPMDNVTPWTAVAKAVQRFGTWSLAGEARYVDARQAGVGPDMTRVPAAWTLRASARVDMDHAWLQATLEDLTNSRRQDLVGPEYAPVTWMRADGRALRVTLGFRL
jgi:iron complex outermembrane receptor protein